MDDTTTELIADPADTALASPDLGMPSVETVRALEAMMLEMPQVDINTQHLIFGGMYARTILIPAGTMLTGALSALDNICIVHGDITVTTDAGSKRLSGFHVLPALAGAKRVGIAHTDTWWTTLIKTDATTVQAAEDEFTFESDVLATRRLALTQEHWDKPILGGC